MGASASVAVAAFCASAAETLIGYSFDTVKTRMQAQHSDSLGSTSSGSAKAYRGPLHCAVVTVQREGWGALYRGLPCSLTQSLLWMLLLLGAIDRLRRATGATIFSPLSFLFACTVVGAMEALLFCPLDLIKARMQVKGVRRSRLQNSGSFGALGGLAAAYSSGGGGGGLLKLVKWGEKQTQGALRTAREVRAARGWSGLYTGWVYHFLKETAGAAALLGVYDSALAVSGASLSADHRTGSPHLHPQGLHWLHLWPASCLALLAYYLVSYPLDTLKTRVQTDSLSVPHFRNSLQAALMSWQQGGLGDLYKGVGACLCRAVPGSVVKIVVFEVCIGLLNVLASMPLTIDHQLLDVDKLGHLEHILM